MTNDRSAAAIMGLPVAVGLALAGWFVAQAATTLRGADRVVEVKGLAEREVPADLALWSLAYTCLLYTSPSPRDRTRSRMPSSA